MSQNKQLALVALAVVLFFVLGFGWAIASGEFDEPNCYDRGTCDPTFP